MNQIKHLAIIMDGNVRWANKNNLLRPNGHEAGVQNASKLIMDVLELNIPYLTLYAFSLENWRRSFEETSFLLNLLDVYLNKEVPILNKNKIKLKVIGKLERLSFKTQERISRAVELTQLNSKMTLCIAFSYGGRAEIIDACINLINLNPQKINESNFKNYLYDPEMPDVDLLIRTGGVFRISNFLLWQSAYAELYFSNKLWPDFTKSDLLLAMEDFFTRKRNFGAR